MALVSHNARSILGGALAEALAVALSLHCAQRSRQRPQLQKKCAALAFSRMSQAGSKWANVSDLPPPILIPLNLNLPRCERHESSNS